MVELSVIIPVTERIEDVRALYEAYRKAVSASGLAYEFIYVLDGEYPQVARDLGELQGTGEPVRVIGLAKAFGEATALSIGLVHSNGDLILTLPAYLQIDPEEIPKLLNFAEQHDVVTARRSPKTNSRLNLMQSLGFHWLLRMMVSAPFHDLGCGVRVFKKSVLRQLTIYGDQHRFLPLLAYHRGFDVHELTLRQAAEDAATRIYPMGIYIRRFLDILGIAFLIKFTHKPLRFFGLIGAFTLTLGVALFAYLVIAKLGFGVPMGDRPLLILSTLLIVLAVQIVAIGLVGELLIFTRGKELSSYAVAEIVEPEGARVADIRSPNERGTGTSVVDGPPALRQQPGL